ncbi:hypothetical protein BDV18DRAFT_155541 [Aspergillus unguis]
MAATVPFPCPPYPESEPRHRRKVMKVLALGMPRTGNMSLCSALNSLGYNTYHMTEACLHYRSGSLKDWNQAIAAKYYGKGREYKGEDFDRILWDYDAVTDIPCILFVDELLDAYPEAKIILTTRDPNKWAQSMQRGFVRVARLKRLRMLSFLDSTYHRPLTKLLKSTLQIWTDSTSTKDADTEGLKAAYIAHNAEVLGSARLRGRKVLEYDVEQGWGPLCRFLGHAQPTCDFPVVSEGGFLAGWFYLVFWRRVLEVLLPVVVTFVWWFGVLGGYTSTL